MVGVNVESVQCGKKGDDVPPRKIGENRLDRRILHPVRFDQIRPFVQNPTAVRGGEDEIIFHILEEGQEGLMIPAA